MKITVNGRAHHVDVAPDTPILWVLRETLGLTGTKFGCGIAQCGACTVHLNGAPIRSCVTPVAAAADASITTIEGLRSEDGSLHPVQEAWIAEQVPQCGYCQSGQIMQAAGLLSNTPNPSDDQIVEAMNGNLCRCMSYTRIHKAIKSASGGEEA